MNPLEAGAPAGYAGDIPVREAWTRLAADEQAVLVDVRSDAEWTFVGVPDLSSLGKAVTFVPWQIFPGMRLNGDFSAMLQRSLPEKSTPLLFLCRSGGRSRAAAQAMAALGYTSCFNVAGGFEGDADDERHRGGVNGWKAEGLPWRQS